MSGRAEQQCSLVLTTVLGNTQRWHTTKPWGTVGRPLFDEIGFDDWLARMSDQPGLEATASRAGQLVAIVREASALADTSPRAARLVKEVLHELVRIDDGLLSPRLVVLLCPGCNRRWGDVADDDEPLVILGDASGGRDPASEMVGGWRLVRGDSGAEAIATHCCGSHLTFTASGLGAAVGRARNSGRLVRLPGAREVHRV